MILNDLLSADTPVIVQGATGHTARHHITVMKQHGTRIVAGRALNNNRCIGTE